MEDVGFSPRAVPVAPQQLGRVMVFLDGPVNNRNNPAPAIIRSPEIYTGEEPHLAKEGDVFQLRIPVVYAECQISLVPI